jgi:hypothetical protein
MLLTLKSTCGIVYVVASFVTLGIVLFPRNLAAARPR